MTGTKRIGILGSGDVAKTLGRGFAHHGYEVMLGTRDPSKLEEWRSGGPGRVAVGSPAQAAAFADTVVLATHGAATESVLEAVGPRALAGKLVLDATNPLDFSHGMPPALFVGTTDSLGERIQRKLPESKVVKCFNTVGHVKMVDPRFSSGPARMWICGNDAGAKRRADEIVRELGWAGTLDVGGIDGARWLEAMVQLWLRAGQALNTWEHAIQPVL